MIAIDFVFPLADGLHARPASLMQEACLAFAAACRFRNLRNGRHADARSVLELVASDTAAHDPCRLEISGMDETKAGRSLNAFLRADLPHADDDTPLPPAATIQAAWLPPVFRYGAASVLPGRALASGIGLARALVLQKKPAAPRGFAAGKKDLKKELRLFRDACRETEAELRSQAATAKNASGAAIMKAHLAMISDPGFRERIAGLISKKKMAAGTAIAKTTAIFTRTLRCSASAYLRERAADLEDIADRLYEKLYGRPSSDSSRPGQSPQALKGQRPGGPLVHRGQRPYGPLVVVAAGLTPSELLALDRRRLRGLVLGEVGLTSHTAILARAFAIPAVTLPAAALKEIIEGEELTVDGQRGLVCRGSKPVLKRYYRLETGKLRLQAARLADLRKKPARTRDGLRVEIAANIGSSEELAGAWRNGAEAIGLLRTEKLFLERESAPLEDEQFTAYRQAALSAKGRTVIVRTLDVGGDKPLPYLDLPREENPFLGVRAVRFYAEKPELVKSQLRAILRAARHGNLKVMVPMVSGLQEVRLVRRLLAEAGAELRERKIPHAKKIEIGIMVETPAAALSIDQLSGEADFFSVGSNDLLQYFLAVDRGNARMGYLYDPLHPAFLRLLSQAAGQARKAKRWLGICGEMAGNPEYLPLLIGLGFNELSMAAPAIPAVKERLARLDSGACRALLEQTLLCADAAEVARLLGDFNDRAETAEVIAADAIRLDSQSRSAAEAIKELCDLLELGGRVQNAFALEEAVWKREATSSTNLGFGFALPHGKTAAVRTASIAFLRPRRPMRWGEKEAPSVQAILLIAIPAARGDEHLRLIARLARRLMHEEFRETLLAAKDAKTVLAAIRACLAAK